MTPAEKVREREEERGSYIESADSEFLQGGKGSQESRGSLGGQGSMWNIGML